MDLLLDPCWQFGSNVSMHESIDPKTLDYLLLNKAQQDSKLKLNPISAEM